MNLRDKQTDVADETVTITTIITRRRRRRRDVYDGRAIVYYVIYLYTFFDLVKNGFPAKRRRAGRGRNLYCAHARRGGQFDRNRLVYVIAIASFTRFAVAHTRADVFSIVEMIFRQYARVNKSHRDGTATRLFYFTSRHRLVSDTVVVLLTPPPVRVVAAYETSARTCVDRDPSPPDRARTTDADGRDN